MKYEICKIKKACDELLTFDMFFNLDESFFWPIMELIDIDENSIIELYNTIEKKYYKILYYEPLIIPLIESTQSKNLVNFSRNIKEKNSNFIDDILISDMESALFFNYDTPLNLKKTEEFKYLYMKLKQIILDAKDKYQNNENTKKTLNYTINLAKKNECDYFNYVHVYWLSHYFNKAKKTLIQTEIEYYKNHLSKIFPYGKFK
ncbi:hypothetical protein [Proteus sp. FME41]|uniref:hypothetical protein n=1 Tax=Proteus sp. FME41 TaxID=2742608 RepID=UPI001867C6E8|nr:hypothetical protein [Proteus sp. FME41]